MNHPETKWIEHNKHPIHPLKEVYKNAKFECKFCKTKGKGLRFRCQECDFDMHTVCGTCPATLSTTFAHPEHVVQLTDIPKLIRHHKCNLCKKTVKGTVYKCEACKFFMHPVCGQLPELLLNHAIHPPHSLKLQLMATSKCDVCDKSCKHCRYFCEICDVHIHVGCLNGRHTSDDDDDDEGGFGDVILVEVLGAVLSGAAQSALGFLVA